MLLNALLLFKWVSGIDENETSFHIPHSGSIF